MIDRRRFLFVLGQDPVAWARRWDIEPFTGPCHRCGRLLTTSRPFAVGTMRGLAAPLCACGLKETPYCVVGARGDRDLFPSS